MDGAIDPNVIRKRVNPFESGESTKLSLWFHQTTGTDFVGLIQMTNKIM